ncbi:hypothetical protein CERSUDRAFT_113793 [Gelatoporia subvermispora B]|uniref:Protein CMS1 n=1 Tax=Ceriporiopsis subvermispora (strain B) TaxID=914234 RepID=M2PQ00_CERS8|nr:hypothetical protein CERSUDRAFT_113793 [Gelatoporia subvermispora B]
MATTNATTHRGDDLDDDFVLDDLVALSDEDVVQPADADDIAGLLSAEEASEVEGEPSRNNSVSAEKKRKRREKEKERKLKRRKMAEASASSEASSVAAQPPALLANYVSTTQAKTFSKMSDIELADIQIPENSIADTTMWSGSRDLEHLVEFITATLPTLRTRLGQNPKSMGAPTLIFVAAAALRVADVTRVLKDKKLRGEKGGDVAKLFAKHFKLEEHVAQLKRTKIGAAVGTPGRLGKLLENGALSTSALTHIMLDVSHRDAKQRCVLDIPETRDEVFKTVLGSPNVLKGLKQGQIQLVLL